MLSSNMNENEHNAKQQRIQQALLLLNNEVSSKFITNSDTTPTKQQQKQQQRKFGNISTLTHHEEINNYTDDTSIASTISSSPDESLSSVDGRIDLALYNSANVNVLYRDNNANGTATSESKGSHTANAHHVSFSDTVVYEKPVSFDRVTYEGFILHNEEKQSTPSLVSPSSPSSSPSSLSPSLSHTTMPIVSSDVVVPDYTVLKKNLQNIISGKAKTSLQSPKSKGTLLSQQQQQQYEEDRLMKQYNLQREIDEYNQQMKQKKGQRKVSTKRTIQLARPATVSFESHPQLPPPAVGVSKQIDLHALANSYNTVSRSEGNANNINISSDTDTIRFNINVTRNTACRNTLHRLHTNRNDLLVESSHENYSSIIASDNIESYMFGGKGHDKSRLRCIRQYKHFMQSYALDVVCLVYNDKLQIIGTYDISTSRFVKSCGIVLGPDYLNKLRGRCRNDNKRCNLLDVKLHDLLEDTFAIVPIFMTTTGSDGDVDFSLDLYAKDVRTRRCSTSAPSNSTGTSDSSDLLHMQKQSKICTEIDGGVQVPSTYLTSNDNSEYCWQRLNSFNVSSIKTSTPTDTSGDGEPSSPSPSSQSMIPLIIHKVYNHKERGSNSWLLNHTNVMYDTNLIDRVIENVNMLLCNQHIIPSLSIHIEHCINCIDHQTTTRHIPGSYDKAYTDYIADLKRHLLPFNVVRNRKRVVTNGPRVGAFEVTMQKFNSSDCELLFSKLRQKSFPKYVHNDFYDTLIPRFDCYDNNSASCINVCVCDAYYHIPIPNLLVTVYRIDSFYTPAEADASSVLDSNGTIALTATDSAPSTVALSKVRTWRKSDVQRWFRSFNATEFSITNAINAGVVDGLSLLKMVDDAALVSWGVLNLLTRQKLLKHLEDMTEIRNSSSTTGAASSGDSHYSRITGASKDTLISTRIGASGNDFYRDTIHRQVTDASGMLKCSVHCSGSYVITVVSTPAPAPDTSTNSAAVTTSHSKYSHYTSSVITVNRGSTAFNYYVSLPPKAVKVSVSVMVDMQLLQALQSKYSLKYSKMILITFYNIQSREHHVCALPCSNSGSTSYAQPSQMLEGAISLPIGTYLSGVSGEVMVLSSDTGALSVDYRGSKVVECHRHALLRGVILLQRLFRSYMNEVTTRALYIYFIIKMRMGKCIKRARDRLYIKKVVMIQSSYRQHRVRAIYARLRKGITVIQNRHRKGVAKQVYMQLKRQKKEGIETLFKGIVMQSNMRYVLIRARMQLAILVRQYISKKRSLKQSNATRIQSHVRTMSAKVKLSQLKAKSHNITTYKPQFKTVLSWFQSKLSAKQLQEMEAQSAAIEVGNMACEELRMRKFVRQDKECERLRKETEMKQVREMLQQMERKRVVSQYKIRKSVSIIQRNMLMYVHRCRYRRIKRCIVSIQCLVRRGAAVRKVNRLKHSQAKQRIRQIINSSLSANSLMYNSMSDHNNNTSNGNSNGNSSSKSSSGRKGTIITNVVTSIRNAFIGTAALTGTSTTASKAVTSGLIADLLTQVGNQRATKIQSHVRMRIARKRYIAKRNALQLSPPKHYSSHLLLPRKGTKRLTFTVSASTGVYEGAHDDTIVRRIASFRSSFKFPSGIQALRLLKSTALAVSSKGLTTSTVGIIVLQACVRGAQCRKQLVLCRAGYQEFIKRWYQQHLPVPVPNDAPADPVAASDTGTESDAPAAAPGTDDNVTVGTVGTGVSGSEVVETPMTVAVKDRFRPIGLAPIVIAAVTNEDLISNPPTSGSDTGNSTATGSKVETPMTPLASLMATLTPKPGTPLHHMQRKMSGIIARTSSTASTLISDSVVIANNTIIHAKNRVQDKIIRNDIAHSRNTRLEASTVALYDALVSINTTVTTKQKVPSIDIQWYMMAITKSTNVIDGTESRDMHYSRKMYPFCMDTYLDFRFHVHLADTSYYSEIEMRLYMEVYEGGSLEPLEVYRHGMTNGGGSDDSYSVYHVRKRFVPAFTCDYKRFQLKRGSRYPPTGGRVYLSLLPNLNEIMYVDDSKALVRLNGLHVIATLLPIAIPSSSYIRTFIPIDSCAPIYPSHLVDVEQLTSSPIRWDAFSGSAICATVWRDVILVSTKNKLSPYCVFAYEINGTCIGHVNDQLTSSTVGTILTIIAGHSHVALCSSTGAITFLSTGTTAVGTGITAVGTGSSGSGSSGSGSSSRDLSKLLTVKIHSKGIYVGCVAAYAGMDFFFTCDKSGAICSTMMDKGCTIKSCLCDPFLSAAVTAMSCYGNNLYFACIDGSITIISLHYIFTEGMFDMSRNLDKYVTAHVSIFDNPTSDNSSGIVSLAIMTSGREYFSMYTDSTYHQDHAVLLVGGGDAHPIVKVYHHDGTSPSLLPVTTLVGHNRAVTSIEVDAAGRYIFTASSLEKCIKVWDGLTFSIEVEINDVNIAGIAIGPDCLIATSYTIPFLRLWTCSSSSSRMTDYCTNATRNTRWCYNALKGINTSSIKTSIAIPYYDDSEMSILNSRWQSLYLKYQLLETPNGGIHGVSTTATTSAFNGRGVSKAVTPRAAARRAAERQQLAMQWEADNRDSRRVDRTTYDTCSSRNDANTDSDSDGPKEVKRGYRRRIQDNSSDDEEDSADTYALQRSRSRAFNFNKHFLDSSSDDDSSDVSNSDRRVPDGYISDEDDDNFQ